ncbi:MAG: zinc-dependent alcohol dehydrogenase family protein [Promethearchaeota archaeon]
MKAMLIKEQGKLNANSLIMEDVEIPIIGKDDILIKMKACGVCHTDLHEIEGDLKIKEFPIIPGHEVIGIVEKKGENVKKLNIGDRVGVAWLYSTCGKCKYCLRGQENLCEEAKFTGYTANGGYAEYLKINSNFAYKIPKIFTDISAAPLMCAGVIGYRSIRLSEIKEGERLGLFGFGASAHIVIQIANYWGCETFVFTRSKNHQKHALELGAKWVGTSKDTPPKKIDRGIIFAPAGSIVLDALKVLDKGGTLAINAIHMSDIPSIKYSYLWHERKIISVANVTRRDAIEFLEIAGKIPIKTTTIEYKLEDANQALMDMKMSKINGAAVLKI